MYGFFRLSREFNSGKKFTSFPSRWRGRGFARFPRKGARLCAFPPQGGEALRVSPAGGGQGGGETSPPP